MYKHFFKRVIDFTLSLLALLVIWPILLVIYIWLTIANKGAGALFYQERPGLHGKIFKVIKFKTMTDERDAEGNLLPDADRLTKVGRFVRSTSIDELPQLINVLIGDMSFVGPRPEVADYVELYTPYQRQVLQVRPGITGLASIRFRNENDLLTASDDPNRTYIEQIMPKKIELDLEYIPHASVFYDIKLIFQTFAVVIKE